MASFDDKTIAVARVYAEALSQASEARGETESLLNELQDLAAFVDKNPAFQDFLASPLVDTDRRKASLEKVFRGKASDLMVDALQVLNRKGRIGLVPAIAASFEEAFSRARNLVDVQVKSALPLSDAQRQGVQAAVERQTGRKARLITTVDPALIGGLVVQMGDQKLDSSVATRLRSLSNSLLARASREILSGVHFED